LPATLSRSKLISTIRVKNAPFSPLSTNLMGRSSVIIPFRKNTTEETKVPTHLLKELRAQTLAGYSDCKAALVAEKNDIKKAEEWLRKKGVLKAAKKADRVAADGVLGLLVNESRNEGFITEINCETDFVSRGESFSKLSSEVTQTAQRISSGKGGLNDVLADLAAQKEVSDGIVGTISKLGENIKLRRAFSLKTNGGLIGSYMHRVQESEIAKPVTLGKIASLVALKCDNPDSQVVRDLANKIAVHIVGYDPHFLSKEEITENDFANYESAFKKKQEDKLADKDKKFNRQNTIEDVVLLEQDFALYGSKKVSEVLKDLSREIGSEVTIEKFVKVTLGEGIEKKEDDFAKEVESMIKK